MNVSPDAADRRASVTVVNVLSAGRSGSTVLATLLGQHPGVFYAGELQPLWGPAWLPDELCSCGQPVLRCPLWGPIFAELLGEDVGAAIRHLRRLRDRTTRARHVLLARCFARRAQEAAEFLAATARLYLAIQRATGCRVIVDTSKWPSYSVVVGRIAELDWRVVHLVRDPRAVAYSWSRPKRWKNARGEQEVRLPAHQAAYYWLVQNGLIEAFRPRFAHYTRVRYEDFAADPQAVLSALLAFIGALSGPVPTAACAQPGERHILGANPDRFTAGTITVRPDEEWRQRMSPAARWVVTALAWPLMRRYGYLR
jgi:hypothetical protein